MIGLLTAVVIYLAPQQDFPVNQCGPMVICSAFSVVLVESALACGTAVLCAVRGDVL